jgi:hypothetical protein
MAWPPDGTNFFDYRLGLLVAFLGEQKLQPQKGHEGSRRKEENWISFVIPGVLRG